MSVAGDQLRAFFERIERPADRLDYVLERMEPCRGVSRRAIGRAFWLASKLFGVDFEEAKMICRLGWFNKANEAAARIGHLPPDAVGHVYVARAEGWPGRVKVGFSTDLDARRRRLSGQYGRRIDFIRTFVGTMLDEHAVHCDRDGLRLEGEWFRAAGV